MRRMWVAVVFLAWLAVGCGKVSEKVARENIANATLHFHPDVPNGNVDEWWYQFDTAGTDVTACNSNGEFFTATGWTYDEEAQTITVNFGSDYEKYGLTAGSDSLESGRFTYDNSWAIQMEGDWDHLSSRPCDAMAKARTEGTGE